VRRKLLSSFASLGIGALALVVACDSVDEATHGLEPGAGGTGGGGGTGGTARPGVVATGGASSTGSGATGGHFYTCGGKGGYAGSAPGKGGAGNAEAGATGEAGAPIDAGEGEAGTNGTHGEGGAAGANAPTDVEPIVCSAQPVNEQPLPLPDVRESWATNAGVFTDACAPNGTLIEYHCEYVVSCEGECVHQPTGNVVRSVSPCPSGCVDGACAGEAD
jgi:hypothetical protein